MEKAEKRQCVETEKKKKKLEYLKKLWDEVLVEDTVFIESLENS